MAAIAGTAGVEPTYAALSAGRTSLSPTRNASSAPARPSSARRPPWGLGCCPSTASTMRSSRRSAMRIPMIEMMTLTACGRSFRTWTAEAIAKATPEKALQASQLVDGPKGHRRFRRPDEQRPGSNRGTLPFWDRGARLDVFVHAQSIVHGLVAFRDGSVTAGLARPTCGCRSPIACLILDAAHDWAPGALISPPSAR